MTDGRQELRPKDRAAVAHNGAVDDDASVHDAGPAVSGRGRRSDRAARPRQPRRAGRHRYGPARANVADLWLPPVPDRPAPVVVLVHGGYWRSMFTKGLMTPLARDVVGHGWAVWNVEYRRTGAGGGGGGWPATFDDVARAVDHLRIVDGVDADRVVLCGHSAGGHLAAWVAGRHRLPAGTLGSVSSGSSPAVVLRGVVSLAGVVDLRAAASAGGAAAAAVGRLLGPDPDGAKLAAASPMDLLPFGVPQVLVHGRNDETVPVSMSERYARRASAAGDDVRLEVVEGDDHRDVIRPGSASWSVAVGHAARLLA